MLGGQLIDFLFAVGLVTHGRSALWLPPQSLSVPQEIKAEHSMWFESKWPELSRCQSPETHSLAVGNVQWLWGQANASSHQVPESWCCAKSHGHGDKDDGWVSSWMSDRISDNNAWELGREQLAEVTPHEKSYNEKRRVQPGNIVNFRHNNSSGKP